MNHTEIMNVRPYQLMCIICANGRSENGEPEFNNPRLEEIYKKIKADRHQLIRLCANVDERLEYAYQNPGHKDDTPEGELFNQKRDVDILQKFGLFPGDIRPANELIHYFFKFIKETGTICGFPDSKIQEWRGCKDNRSGNYEKGIAKGQGFLFPSLRSQETRDKVKKRSAEEIYKAKELVLRPGHLMCIACFYGGCLNTDKLPAPLDHDNLFEIVDRMKKEPNVPVKIMPTHCMVCPPCGNYDEKEGTCPSSRAAELRATRKKIEILQVLDLQYGDVLPAKEIMQRVFDRIKSTKQICGFGDGIVRGGWHICGSNEGSPSYAKGRKEGLGIPGVKVED